MKNRENSSNWFTNVLEELGNEIDMRLQLDSETTWTNVPDEMQSEIKLAVR